MARDPYAGQPSQPGGYQSTDDPKWSACQQQANPQLAICNAVLATGKNTSSAWELRGSYDQLAQTCPTHAHEGLVGQLEGCVAKLEAIELQDDPQAPSRRAAAKQQADATRQDPEFRALIDQWTQALDGKNITCRNRQVDESHRRECERWHGEMKKVEDQLEQYLVAHGYDRRDIRALGLWPHDRNWRTSPN
jgi:hypothetical protein